MILQTIPLYNDTANYSIRIQLDSVTYTLSFRLNTRLNTWVLEVGDEFGNPVLSGVPILLGQAMLDQFLSYNIPPGGLVLFGSEDNTTQPTQETFSQLYTLVYNGLFA